MYILKIIEKKGKECTMEIFKNDNYKWISKLVEEKMPILKQNEDFNNKNLSLTQTMESFEKALSVEQKETFNKIIKLFYETEQYYFALSYLLGIKFGEDLKKI